MENYFFETGPEVSDNRIFALIVYDIVENRKRARLAKLLEGYGFRIQKSAFEAFLKPQKYEKLIQELKRFESKGDSIRLYIIRGRGEVVAFGDHQQSDEEEIVVL